MGSSLAPSMRQVSYSQGSRTSISRSFSPASSFFFSSAGVISSSLIGRTILPSGPGILADVFQKMRESLRGSLRKRSTSFDGRLPLRAHARALLFDWRIELFSPRGSAWAVRRRFSQRMFSLRIQVVQRERRDSPGQVAELFSRQSCLRYRTFQLLWRGRPVPAGNTFRRSPEIIQLLQNSDRTLPLPRKFECRRPARYSSRLQQRRR